jgi:fucose 4-O-acetylase-like acetyltransferase
VALAGFFSSPHPHDSNALKKILSQLVVPYLIFEVIWSAIAMIRAGKWSFDPLMPSWTLWFLLSLVAWRVVLPFLASTRAPLSLSVVIGLSSGYFAVDQTLSLSRTLALLPFFVLGWRLSTSSLPSWWAGQRGSVVRFIRASSLLVLVAAASFAYWFGPSLPGSPFRWLFTYDRPYDESGLGEWWSAAIRLVLYLLAIVLMVALVTLVPRAETWMSAYGRTTLYVYLLHTFPIALLRGLGVLSADTSLWLVLALLPVSIALTMALGSPFIVRITKVLVQPEWVHKLLR